MTALIKIQPNKLIYPGGQAQPGFNYAHPVLRSLGIANSSTNPAFVCSAIPNVGNYIALGSPTTTSRIATLTNAPAFGMDGAFGPCITAVSNKYATFTALTGTGGGTNCVYAAFVRQTASIAGYGNIIQSQNQNDGIYIHSNVFILYRGGDVTSGISLTIGQPYFIICAVSSVATYFIVKNLLTGGVQTATAAGGGISVPAVVQVGSDSSSETFVGNIGPVSLVNYAFSGTTTPIGPTLPDLLQWAEDPWSFWYPQKIGFEDTVTPAQSQTTVLQQGFYEPILKLRVQPESFMPVAPPPTFKSYTTQNFFDPIRPKQPFINVPDKFQGTSPAIGGTYKSYPFFDQIRPKQPQDRFGELRAAFAPSPVVGSYFFEPVRPKQPFITVPDKFQGTSPNIAGNYFTAAFFEPVRLKQPFITVPDKFQGTSPAISGNYFTAPFFDPVKLKPLQDRFVETSQQPAQAQVTPVTQQAFFEPTKLKQPLVETPIVELFEPFLFRYITQPFFEPTKLKQPIEQTPFTPLKSATPYWTQPFFDPIRLKIPFVTVPDNPPGKSPPLNPSYVNIYQPFFDAVLLRRFVNNEPWAVWAPYGTTPAPSSGTFHSKPFITTPGPMMTIG